MTDNSAINLSLEGNPNPEVSEIASAYSDSPEFAQFIQDAFMAVETGTPVAHVLANVVMHLFQPGFVIIGSPSMMKLNGNTAPRNMGIAMGGKNNMTATDLAILLRDLADSLEANQDPSVLFDE